MNKQIYWPTCIDLQNCLIADTWAELFRGRTLAVAILTEYVNTMCRGYLRIAVGSIVKKLISQKKTLEVISCTLYLRYLNLLIENFCLFYS